MSTSTRRYSSSRPALEQAQNNVWRGRAAHVAVFFRRSPDARPEDAGRRSHAPFFAPLFRFINNAADEPQIHSELESFLRSPTVRRRADDDLTLFLAAARHCAGDGPLTLTDARPDGE